MHYLRLVRPLNLGIIALTQILFQFAIIVPLVETANFEISLDTLGLSLVVLATLCVAAAGYVFNDYFDMPIDRINRPDKMIVGRWIAPTTSLYFAYTLSAIGLAAGLWAAIRVGNFQLVSVFILALAIAWFYAGAFKKTFLVGNLLVATLTMLTMVVMVLFERNIFVSYQTQHMFKASDAILKLMLVYGGFAFLSNWMRELVKDMEDIEGDDDQGARTLPIVWGMNGAKYLFLALNAILLFASVLFAKMAVQQEAFVLLAIVSVGVIIPCTFIPFMMIRAKHKNQYARISLAMKAVMMAGITSMIGIQLL